MSFKTSKWVKDLNVRLDTIKLLEQNTGRTHFDINCSNIFLDPSLRIMEIKTKINKWDLTSDNLKRIQAGLWAFSVSKKKKNNPVKIQKGFKNLNFHKSILVS